jgi:hypothetical protein
VPRAAGIVSCAGAGVGALRAVAAQDLFEEGFEGGEAAGDDACVAFDAVGAVNACLLDKKEKREVWERTQPRW